MYTQHTYHQCLFVLLTEQIINIIFCIQIVGDLESHSIGYFLTWDVSFCWKNSYWNIFKINSQNYSTMQLQVKLRYTIYKS